MAIFGAPTALEHHAFRAAWPRLIIQSETARLAEEVDARDGIALQLRVGLNSGQAIAGEIGSGALGYVYFLGYGDNAAAKCGSPPHGLGWLTWSPNAIPAEQFYGTISTLIHKTGGSRENYCRAVVEAYAQRVVPIVEDDYGFPSGERDGVNVRAKVVRGGS